MAKRIFLNLDRCIGCRSCAAACHYSHNRASTLGLSPVREDAVLPMLCRHCAEPACVAACTRQALQRLADGTVVRRAMLCVGCKSCVVACPFGALDMALHRHIVAKCDVCLERGAEGKDPACVSGCPAGALRFEEESASPAANSTLVGSRMVRGHPLFNRR